jgi:hypothetical protein
MRYWKSDGGKRFNQIKEEVERTAKNHLPFGALFSWVQVAKEDRRAAVFAG